MDIEKARIMVAGLAGNCGEDYREKKAAFCRAIGAGVPDLEGLPSAYALAAMRAGTKSPDEVVAIAMLVFQQ